jgi:GNAT superfamily N-acetyltransferase
MTLTTLALSPATWPPYAALIEAHHGVWGGCWCMAFHPEGLSRQHSPADRRALKEARVRDGTAHAALVFDGPACVGWCQFGPTATLPRIKNRKEYDRAASPLPDWRITCFFVAQSHRRQGVAILALQGALTQIAALGGGVVEGYPDDTANRKTSASFLWGGTLTAFEAQGFTRQRLIGKTGWVVARTVTDAAGQEQARQGDRQSGASG